MSGVSIRQVEIGFGLVKVLEALDLDVAEGEFMVLLGPSGCGKSTLLSAIAGLIDVSAGQIWIGGKNVTWAEPKDRGIGMVFQSYALYPRMTVLGNLTFGLKMARVPKAEIDRRVARAAAILQIGPLLGRRPAELSGGQRQRVAIGRALVRDAGVFLFDEPLSNLDAKLRTELRIELKRLHAELGTTMIYVTHDQIEALTLADRIAVMNGGVIQQLGTPQETYARPQNRFVAGFIGSPAMNMLDGTLHQRDGRAVFALPGGEVLDLAGYAFREAPSEGRPATLGIRPEGIALERGGRHISALPVSFNLIEPMGADGLAWGSVGGRQLSVRIEADEPVPLEGPTQAFFNPAQASVFGDDGNRL